MSIIERKPSFFRKGGLVVPNQVAMTFGRKDDGNFYILLEYRGRSICADLTPKMTEDLADGMLTALGLTYDNARTNGKGI